MKRLRNNWTCSSKGDIFIAGMIEKSLKTGLRSAEEGFSQSLRRQNWLKRESKKKYRRKITKIRTQYSSKCRGKIV
jgi:hypothetical protein